MSEKGYVFLLIFCGILCQGIIATSSDDDIRESSDLLVREKRVIDHDKEGFGVIPIEKANYMTFIKEDGRANCVGVKLSHHTLITAAVCVLRNISVYYIVSGTVYADMGTVHRISSKVINSGNPPHGHFDGIALLNVDPPFIFGPKTGNILLYTGTIRAGTEATVAGWGTSYPLIKHMYVQRKLRQITIPIMNHKDCENTYRHNFVVSHKFICTYHARRYLARTDNGAPLVINNMLAGIHVLKPEIENQENPDIFIDLQLPEYSVWIRQNIRFE